LKGRFLLLKILKRTKKRSRFLKKEILIVFIHLEASFFPDTFLIGRELGNNRTSLPLVFLDMQKSAIIVISS
ncbi:hypothetical protein AAA420_12575, partial [Lactobacillus crispatus]|uniref:hypothetical protein n=1 Tax=Lactobacillus crispatus TaxID=47770 RepID=UPI0030F4EFEA